MNGDIGLFVVVDDEDVVAALTVRIIDYPHQRTMAIDWLGGSRMKEWLPDAMAKVKQFAKDNGVVALEGFGRRAWTRVLERYGFKADYIAMRCEVD